MNYRRSTNRLATLLAVMCLLSSQLPAASPQAPQTKPEEVKPDSKSTAKRVMRINADGKAEEVKPGADAPGTKRVVKINADGKAEEVKTETGGKVEESKQAASTPAKKKEITLNVGDPAPAIKAARWLKGSPIEAFKKGEIYVLEFWATWCGPCKDAMPHITEMAKNLAGKVTFIGMDIWEKADSPTALDQQVDKFVKDMGEKMDYTVAQDTRDEYMSMAWMKAAGRPGIPSSFIVGKDGRIWWVGHPKGLKAVLDSILAGTFEIKDSAKEAKEEQKWNEALNEAFLAFLPFEPPMGRALRAKDWSQALKVADEAQAKLPGSVAMREQLLPYRIQAQAHLDPAKVQPLLESVQIAGKARTCEVAAMALVDIRDLNKNWSALALTYLDKANAVDPTNPYWKSDKARFPFLLCTDPAKAQAIWDAADFESQFNFFKGILGLKGVSRQWMEKAVAILESKIQKSDPGMATVFSPYLAQGCFELGRFKEAVAAQEKWVAFLTQRGWKGYWLLEQAEEDLKVFKAALK